jgi:dolichyl-phosphate-mannose-protein mannosyltransferase
VLTFHANYLACSEHSYASSPAGWLLVTKPVSVAVENDIQPGDQGCEARESSTCRRQVIMLNNVVVWWGGVLALLAALAWWAGARDWRYGIAVVGAASTWLPWLRYDDRPIFAFYSIATLPFMILALTLLAGALVGHERVPSARRTAGIVVVGSFLVLAMMKFAWDWPVLTYGLLTGDEWAERIWFSRWV